MQNDLRQALRHAIDQHARAQHAAAHQGVCAGCGTDRQLKTVGCKRCSDRHLKWKYRKNSDYIARELERQRLRLATRVARQKARRAQERAARA